MRRILYILIAAVLTAGCIKNDIPYPVIQANITSMEAAGMDAGAAIDSTARTVTLTFPEETDIYNVQITGYTITPGATLAEDIFSSPIDLSVPCYVTLKYYQDWQWKITGVQNIERYFEVEGQMGQSVIDVPARRVIVYVRSTQDMSRIAIKRVKLGNVGATMSPDLQEGTKVNGHGPLQVHVEVFGHSQMWTVYFEPVDATVQTLGADAWTNVAWVHGQAEAGKDNGVEYRLAGDNDWIKIPKENVSENNGSFTGRIDHLSAQTQYEARAYSDEDVGETVTFTTGTAPQMPNNNFDHWWLEKEKIWNPWEEGGEPFWGTGNPGAATMGKSNSVPTDDTPTGTGWAAKLESKFVGLGGLGKIAAGNLFAGVYVRTDGTNGVLSFGRPFKERPTKLKGMFKYQNVPIDYASAEFKPMIGQPDTCIVWCALIDSAEPFEIRTNPKNRQLFDPNGSYVVAYGKMQKGEPVAQWSPFEFELEYKSTSRVPNYILVTCSASAYGDYFTGGAGSVLYIDDLILEYDY